MEEEGQLPGGSHVNLLTSTSLKMIWEKAWLVKIQIIQDRQNISWMQKVKGYYYSSDGAEG